LTPTGTLLLTPTQLILLNSDDIEKGDSSKVSPPTNDQSAKSVNSQSNEEGTSTGTIVLIVAVILVLGYIILAFLLLKAQDYLSSFSQLTSTF
jgi:hypothetical protein